jgi:ubiquitin C-terminal hydrolase
MKLFIIMIITNILKKNEKIEKFQIHTIGFPNIVNSCYMNSFLQILFSYP